MTRGIFSIDTCGCAAKFEPPVDPPDPPDPPIQDNGPITKITQQGRVPSMMNHIAQQTAALP